MAGWGLSGWLVWGWPERRRVGLVWSCDGRLGMGEVGVGVGWQGGFCLAHNHTEYARAAFDRIDVSRAICRKSVDTDRIIGMVRSLDGGIKKCNEKIRSLLKTKMENRQLGSAGAKKVAEALEGSRLISL